MSALISCSGNQTKTHDFCELYEVIDFNTYEGALCLVTYKDVAEHLINANNDLYDDLCVGE